MSKWLVTATIVGMLVTFACYAVYMNNEVAERETYADELEFITDVLTTTVCKQADMHEADMEIAEANVQRMVSGWHVREMELIDSMQTLGNCGLQGVHDLEAVRDELRAAQADLDSTERLDETLKLIAKAYDNLFVVFMADVKPADPDWMIRDVVEVE